MAHILATERRGSIWVVWHDDTERCTSPVEMQQKSEPAEAELTALIERLILINMEEDAEE